MKFSRNSLAIIAFVTFAIVSSSSLIANSSSEAKTSEQHKVLLSTGTDHERIDALVFFAKEKDKTVIPAIIEVLKDTDSSKVASQAAITLGRIGEKGESTTALKDKILFDENPEVVYSCILGLFNIHKKDEEVDPTAKEALTFAYKNKSKDAFVADILEKLKAKFAIEENS
ncbi:MAG: HEAT repeat domain-containing protein [Leptospiraceae bacterium]|nr:HEAT repeat domain-containing protein [Leptospiraceae bacterium]